MRLLLSYRRTVRSPFAKRLLCDIAEETLRFPGVLSPMAGTVTLNAIAVSSSKIRALNRTYRQKDAETDILAFGGFAGGDGGRHAAEAGMFLGELYFSPTFIERSAREDNLSPAYEFAYVFSHGILHLLGFDHGRDMFRKQDAIAARFASLKK